MKIPDQALIDRELVRRKGLHEFIRRAWHLVEPAKFNDNWHIGAISEHLQALYYGEIERLLINVPPGSGKSLITSVFFPVWVWTLQADESKHEPGPSCRFHYLSYDQKLSLRDAIRARELVNDAWFQDRWGGSDGVKIPFQNTRAAAYYKNNRGGMRITVTLEGGSTGHHAHIQGVDDPIKPKDTQGGADKTRTVLRKVEDLWSGTLATRVADPKFFRRMITMQRLHDADLSGTAIESGTYCHLMIPLRYEPKRAYSTGISGQYAQDPRTREGELMWPSRTDEEAAKKLETELGAFSSAQLQQDPVPSTGGIFEKGWLLYWHTEPSKVPGTLPLPDPKRSYLGQSWDMTFKGKEENDRVAGGIWLSHRARHYLIDQVCDRMGFAETKDAVKRTDKKYPRHIRKLVEDKANGPAIVDDLQQDITGFELVDPEGGKEARAWACQPLVKSGGLVLPHPSMPGYEWVHDYVKELTRFPKAPNDDQVDQTTQWLLYVKLNAPKWVQAMSQVIANEQAAQHVLAAVLTGEPLSEIEPPAAPVDVAGLRARLGL